MGRLIVWWIALTVLVVATAAVRVRAQNVYVALNTSPALIERARILLTSNGFDIVREIRDHEHLIGLRFRDDRCVGDMAVVQFDIWLLARSFMRDHMSTDDNQRYYFYDRTHTGASQPTVALVWARELILVALGQRHEPAMRNQLGVVWPSHCAEPQVHWSSLWTTAEISAGTANP